MLSHSWEREGKPQYHQLFTIFDKHPPQKRKMVHPVSLAASHTVFLQLRSELPAWVMAPRGWQREGGNLGHEAQAPGPGPDPNQMLWEWGPGT